MEKEKKKYRLLLSQKSFLRLLCADVINRFGDSLDVIAYSWIMYEITNSESLMALIMGLNYIPTVLLQPFAGAIVERMKKKNIMVIADVLRCVIVILIASLYASGALTPLLIAILTLCTSTVEAFRIPAGGAILPQLLDKEYFTLGKAANYSLGRAAELIGLTLAGGLIALIGTVGVLWIDAATFIVSALIILTIKYEEKLKKSAIRVKQVFVDFGEGLAFLKSSHTVQIIGLMGLLINFGLMPLSVFQTPYVYDYLKMGPEVLSYIKILMVLGMMTGAALAPKLVKNSNARLATAAGLAMGVSIVLMYVTACTGNILSKMVLLTVSMFGVGIGGGILNVIIGGSMMKAVPRDMMARMSALNAAVMQSSMPIGSFICSAMALRLSTIHIFLIFGIVTIASHIALAASKQLNEL